MNLTRGPVWLVAAIRTIPYEGDNLIKSVFDTDARAQTELWRATRGHMERNKHLKKFSHSSLVYFIDANDNWRGICCTDEVSRWNPTVTERRVHRVGYKAATKANLCFCPGCGQNPWEVKKANHCSTCAVAYILHREELKQGRIIEADVTTVIEHRPSEESSMEQD